MHAIILPDDVKPALEWIGNGIVQKVSPERKHSLAQGRFWAMLDAWAAEHKPGSVGPEWRFLIKPPGEIARTLVPDVAYLSYDRMSYEDQDRIALPEVAPDAVVEIRSPSDRQAHIDEKIAVYLSAGTSVVFLVDPLEKFVEVHDRHGSHILEAEDRISHESLPGLDFPVNRLFDVQRPKQV